jgi:glycosyltransferase involved in cell wall biosynthesis
MLPAWLVRTWHHHVLGYLPLPLPQELKALETIYRSGVWEDGVYRKQLKRLERGVVLRPVLHFMRVGWHRRLSPGAAFNTRWYLERYPDVARSRLNPLVHFLRFGVHEGRLPSPCGVISDFPGLAGSAVWHHHQAWHGHATLGVAALERLADEGSSDALWYLAAWHYGQGEHSRALDYLQRLQVQGGGRFAQRLPQALVKCLLHLGDEAGVKTLREAEHFAPGSPDAALVQLSQVTLPVEERLAGINAWLQRHKLAPLRLRKGASRLSLAALRTRRVRARGRQLPWVSVVVPAYNAAATIRLALKSLLAQSWPRLEILVVDDASEDDTAEKVAELARLEPRVRLIRHERNQGAYAARNTGMRAARGDYLTVHDSDDWSHPEKIERQLGALRRQGVAKAAVSSWVRVDAQLRVLGPWHLCPDWLEPNPSSLLVAREVVETLGVWDAVRVAADNEFIERIRCHYGEASLVSVLPKVPLAFSLTQPDSLTRQSATHVRTIHHGVRHLYHQAARWWHRRHVVPVMSDEGSRRPFPTPLGNSPRGEARLAFEVAVLADASPRNPALGELLDALLGLRQAGHEVVLCPWSRPDDFASRQVADDVWELCHEEEIAVAHADIALRCRQLRVQDLGERESWPDRVVGITEVTRVVELDDTPLPAEQAELLLAYLADGGSEGWH